MTKQPGSCHGFLRRHTDVGGGEQAEAATDWQAEMASGSKTIREWQITSFGDAFPGLDCMWLEACAIDMPMNNTPAIMMSSHESHAALLRSLRSLRGAKPSHLLASASGVMRTSDLCNFKEIIYNTACVISRPPWEF